MSNNNTLMPNPILIKPKRGRKSKADLVAALNKQVVPITNDPITNVPITETINSNIILNIDETNSIIDDVEIVKPALKKRGRKPKGGKIIRHITSIGENVQDKPNVILHLKCSSKDLLSSNNSVVECYSQNNDLSFDFISHNEDNELIKSYYSSSNNVISNNVSNNVISNDNNNPVKCINDNDDTVKCVNDNNNVYDSRDVCQKLKQLEYNLHTNCVNDNKSACFWCTCDFDNPQIYIPKYYVSSSNSYQVYGCFCSPECAVASLMSESIDSSTKFERYHFLNHLYAKIFDYTKNIKPAPNPYYMLDKYYGNLSIQEYRSLLRNERLFLIVDKPLTRILPELHEDNDEFMLNNKVIQSNNYQLKKRTQKKHNKTNILNETFGINTSV
jgi:hypothetical protein